MAKPMTMTQKILAAHAHVDAVEAGQSARSPARLCPVRPPWGESGPPRGRKGEKTFENREI